MKKTILAVVLSFGLLAFLFGLAQAWCPPRDFNPIHNPNGHPWDDYYQTQTPTGNAASLILRVTTVGNFPILVPIKLNQTKVQSANQKSTSNLQKRVK